VHAKIKLANLVRSLAHTYTRKPHWWYVWAVVKPTSASEQPGRRHSLPDCRRFLLLIRPVSVLVRKTLSLVSLRSLTRSLRFFFILQLQSQGLKGSKSIAFCCARHLDDCPRRSAQIFLFVCEWHVISHISRWKDAALYFLALQSGPFLRLAKPEQWESECKIIFCLFSSGRINIIFSTKLGFLWRLHNMQIIGKTESTESLQNMRFSWWNVKYLHESNSLFPYFWVQMLQKGRNRNKEWQRIKIKNWNMWFVTLNPLQICLCLTKIH